MGGVRRAGSWLLSQLLRIRTRLLVVNLVIVMVPLVGIEWARTFEREALDALEQDMTHQAQLIRTVLEHNLDPAGRPRFQLVGGALQEAARRTRSRVRLLDRGGTLLHDSHRAGPPEGPEPPVPRMWGPDHDPRRRHPPGQRSTDPGPLQGRPEIAAARRGELGTATRIHQRIQRVFLFVAMPVMVQRRVQGVVYITRSTVPVLRSLYRLRTRLYQVLAVALGLTALVTLFLAGTISRPLSRLTRGARRMASGDRSASLLLNRRDEIGQLARAFDELVARLDARTRYVAELAGNISHEFKTPLASIRGAAELLADGADADPAARARFFENIQADTRRLDRLVSRLLELSRIEATTEHREPLDLADLVLEVADQFPQHPVEVDLAADTLPLMGNAAHLRAALTALVENAVQHSPGQSPVYIEALSGQDGALIVRVIDNGAGISPANRGRVFERFFTTRAQQGGTGLGLAIVATVVQAHGASLDLQSEPGSGSTFELRFPGRSASKK